MMILRSQKQCAVVVVGVSALTIAAYLLWRRSKKININNNGLRRQIHMKSALKDYTGVQGKQCGIVSAITVYPVKSCKGISLTEATVSELGFENDRQYMVVRENGDFITQRQISRMALVETVLEADGSLLLSAPAMPKLRVPSLSKTHTMGLDCQAVRVWDDKLDAVNLGEEPANWLSRVLEVKCFLVCVSAKHARLIAENTRHEALNPKVSFADGFPFLLASEASLEDLNSRLPSPLPMDRFRPNIVVSGCGAFEEDKWRVVRIGEAIFHFPKLCTRCKMPTIDQATARADPSGQPTVALQAYHTTTKGDVLFGTNALTTAESVGRSVRVGDAVEVLEWF